MVDESLVKEEMVDTVDNNQPEAMDSSIQYGGVGSEPGIDSGGGDEHSGHMVPNKYDQPVLPGQPQSLPDAVAEALAGPSGMQGVSFKLFISLILLFFLILLYQFLGCLDPEYLILWLALCCLLLVKYPTSLYIILIFIWFSQIKS